MHLNGLDLILWLASLILHFALLVVLFAFRRARSFPLFTAAMVGNVAKTILLFGVYRLGSAYAYYYTYTAMIAVDFSLQLGIAYEVVLHVFRPAGRWVPGAKEGFILTGISALFVSGALSWLATPAANYLSDTLSMRANFMAATLMTEVFAGLLVLSVLHGLSWNTHAARIALGFGCYCFLCVITETLHAHFGLKNGSAAFRTVSRIRILVYDTTVLYWIVNFVRRAPAERIMPPELREELLLLHKRTQALLLILAGGRQA